MSETTLGNLTPIVSALQAMLTGSNAASEALQKSLAALSLNTNTLPSYTVAGLPVGAGVGRMAWASNGRNPGEGAGAGTGTAVISNGTIWKAIWSGVLVTA